MSKERLAAFADAILALIMTILVLALDAPKEPTLEGFWDLHMSCFSYALSFSGWARSGCDSMRFGTQPGA
ncbi:MAG: TMEM175 family protein [Olsenella sp.]|nr:TMEM175 family protein [Olsenella sp.]